MFHVYRLLSSVGECDEVPESFLDAITALSGAGPAYVSINICFLIYFRYVVSGCSQILMKT